MCYVEIIESKHRIRVHPRESAAEKSAVETFAAKNLKSGGEQ
jgi:hypothetical protein